MIRRALPVLAVKAVPAVADGATPPVPKPAPPADPALADTADESAVPDPAADGEPDPAAPADTPPGGVPNLADVADPAPGHEPVGAHAFFTGPDGVEAWLDTSGDQPVGYFRDAAQPFRTVRVEDPHAWAAIVDDLGLHEDPVPTLPTPAPAQPSEHAAPPADDAAPPVDDAAGDAPGNPTPVNEAKGIRGRWEAAKHPRDKHGQFISIGEHLDLGGGKGGQVTHISHGSVTIKQDDGKSVTVRGSALKNATTHVAKPGKPGNLSAPGAARKPGRLAHAANDLADAEAASHGDRPSPQGSASTAGQAGEGDGHTRGTKFDTPVDKFGMTYSHAAANDPRVQALKKDDAAWADVPTQTYPVKDGKLLATEKFLRSGPIDKVVSGREPFREGYDPKILRTDQGDVVIDGHHRVAMYHGLGKDMPAKIKDERTKGGTGKAGAAGRTAADAVAAVHGGDVNAPGGAHSGPSDADLAKQLQSLPPGPEFDALHQQMSERADSYATSLLDGLGKIEPGVTKSLSDMADQYGGRMEGLDFRLKAQDSLSRKIRDKSLVSGKPMDTVTGKIGDALRYTMMLDGNRYAEGAGAVLRDFESQGYTVVDQDNTWHPGNIYQGINTVLRSPDGHMFELQFHTEQSFAAKTATHADYEISRDPKAPIAERLAAWNRMAVLQSKVPVPPNVGSVGNQRIYSPPSAPTTAPVSPASAVKSLYDTMESQRRGGRR